MLCFYNVETLLGTLQKWASRVSDPTCEHLLQQRRESRRGPPDPQRLIIISQALQGKKNLGLRTSQSSASRAARICWEFHPPRKLMFILTGLWNVGRRHAGNQWRARLHSIRSAANCLLPGNPDVQSKNTQPVFSVCRLSFCLSSGKFSKTGSRILECSSWRTSSEEVGQVFVMRCCWAPARSKCPWLL